MRQSTRQQFDSIADDITRETTYLHWKRLGVTKVVLLQLRMVIGLR